MKHILITGGAGFVGSNVADRLLRAGHPVRIYDSLSRSGVERNLRWLQQQYGDRVEVVLADVRDRSQLLHAVEGADAVLHFAAQVAVTTSLADPTTDFAINAGGTLNLLEALRLRGGEVPVIFTSTSKVYGGLEDVELGQTGTRYAPVSPRIRERGVSEQRPLNFHSPFGCSKGAAEQYMLDYARSFELASCVFRLGCSYGPRQFGTEDQGWVAHFLVRAIENQPLTIYGDGKQVRDLLFVEDLVDAFLAALTDFERVRGQAFNIGGGAANTVSPLELLQHIEALHGARPEVRYEDWRTGDQRYYVSDTAKFSELTGWRARTSVEEGLRRLYGWLLASRGLELPAAPIAAHAGAS